MRDLILTGFMGTGKSTVASLLAARLGLELMDMDEEIERRAGRSVAETFSQCGEAHFRALEREMLLELRDGGGRVVATGGGALIPDENRRLLTSDQLVFCLTCSSVALMERLAGTESRPLLQPFSPERLEELLHSRATAYAQYEPIDTTGRTPEEVADEIAARVRPEQVAHISFSRHAASTVLARDGLLDELGSQLRRTGAQGTVVLLTDRNVNGHGWADRAATSLQDAGYRVERAVIPAGEDHKNVATLSHLYEECAVWGLDRGGTVVGLGGGVIGDLGGMLAATYMRGVRLVLVPTTLLAQVDAAIGGKVAVDLDAGKNLVGAFYPAEVVLVDPATLATLDTRQLSAGLVEMIKIAAIRSSELFGNLLTLSAPEDVVQRTDLVRAAIQLKTEIVRADPYERGERMLLNFGHTVGHAVEAASRFHLSHGESVAVGMLAELRLAIEERWSAPDLLDPLTQFLTRMGLPLSASGLDPDVVFTSMRMDKKRAAGCHRFALPTTVGTGQVFEVGDASARRAIEYALGGTA